MLLTKEIEVRWNPTTRNHYESFGYIYSVHGEGFIIPIEHLLQGSNLKVDIQCDYCGGKFDRVYSDYTKRKSKYINKDCCKKCTQKRVNEEKDVQQKLGLLTREDKGYFIYEDNILKELEIYINNHNKSIDNLAKNDRGLYDAIWKIKKSLETLIKQLGYKWEEVCLVTPTNYFKDFNNVSERIISFIEEYDRFPSKIEIIKNLKIQQRNIDYHGGIYEIKRKMKYKSDEDLVDSNGFENQSILEWTVAEYLIRNNIPYKREQHPFPKIEGQHRSDFMIESVEGIKFHVEVWGYEKEGKNKRSIDYNKKREYKTELYKKYNINLISLDYEELNSRNIDYIQQYLISCFSLISGYEFKIVSNEYLVSPNKLKDEEMLEIIMKYSDNINNLPKQDILHEKGLSGYLKEIRKRHNTYLSFARKFNKTIYGRSHEWNDDMVFEAMNDIISKRLSITRKNIESLSYGGMFSYTNRTKKSNLLTYKLNYFTKFIDSINFITEFDLKFLHNVVSNKGENVMHKVTPEQQEQAKQILEKYNARQLAPTS